MSRFFTGSSDKITFPVRANLNSAVSSTMTWCAWVYKTVDDSTARRIIDPNGGSDQGFIIQTPNGDFNVGINHPTAAANAVYADALTANVWTHLAFTWNVANNRPLLFINGLPVTATSGADKSGTQAAWTGVSAIIGNRAGNDRVLSGRIAEWGIWNRVLKDSEIKPLGKGYSPRFIPNGLIMYYPLIGKNSPESDVKGDIPGVVTGAIANSHPKVIYPRNFR